GYKVRVTSLPDGRFLLELPGITDINQVAENNKSWISREWVKWVYNASLSASQHVEVRGEHVTAYAITENPKGIPRFLKGLWEVFICVGPSDVGGDLVYHAWIRYRKDGEEHTAGLAGTGDTSFEWDQDKGKTTYACRKAWVRDPVVYQGKDYNLITNN